MSRQYDTKEDIKDIDFGRRQTDGIGIAQLFGLITDIMTELSDIKQTINNGMSEKIITHGEKIDSNSEAIEQLQDTIIEEDSYRRGRFKTWQVIVALISAIGGGVVSTLTVLKLLGMI